jgi:pSer/pThr/pTyr-binding forkhead associated (FHA) protein
LRGSAERIIVARLLVFRGDFVEQEIELGGGPVRIGRAPECDVVLEDPERAVSRAHAEVRYEDGGYLIVDLGSQNGIFQFGARVDRAYLEAQNPVTLGPFRLVIDETDAGSGETSKLGQPPPPPRSSSRRGRVIDDDDVEGADDRLDDSRGRSRGGDTSWWRTHAKTVWLGGAAAVLAGGLGLTQLLSPSGPSDEERIIAHLSGARALLEQLEPQRAITEHIDPALAIDPNSVDANDLKVRAQELADRMAAGARGSESAPPAAPPADTRGAAGRIPGLPPAAVPPPVARPTRITARRSTKRSSSAIAASSSPPNVCSNWSSATRAPGSETPSPLSTASASAASRKGSGFFVKPRTTRRTNGGKRR